MLHAIRARECDGARRLMGAALALLLGFRLLLGPALLPPPEPGLVPICGGTVILYVALDGKAGDPGAKLSDPCPFFGFSAAPPEAGAPVLAAAEAVFPGYPAVRAKTPPEQGGRAGYTSRAPPSVG